MRTKTYLALDDGNSVNIQVYRTEEALFIYRPSRAAAAFKQFLRPALIASPSLLLLGIFTVLINGSQPDDFFVVPFFVAAPFLLLGLAVLGASEKRLVRIDATHIILQTWIFGRGSTKRFPRQGKLELSEHKRFPGLWMFKEQSPGVFNPEASCLSLGPHEVVWLRKVFAEFEKEKVGCRPPGGNVGEADWKTEPTEHNEYTGHSAEYRTLPPGGRQPTESPLAIRSVLTTREHNGRPLVRLEHPSEHSTDEPVAGLFVRCPICHAALPRENVWFEEAAGQCARCNWLFQIGDLQERMPPKHCRIAFREDETGLHLYQKPRHGNLLTISLAVLTVFSAALLYLAWPQEKGVLVLLSPEFLQFTGIYSCAMAIALVLTIRTYHVHRFIDFGQATVRFRTRWLFWERCRTVARFDVGAFYKKDIAFFGGVYIPYGRKRSFYVLTTSAEEMYLVSTVNRWLWRNEAKSQNEEARRPPGGYIGGLGEPECVWQMFCPHCGRQFLGEELDFARRESLLRCPNCQQVFTLENMKTNR
ncbi:MAG: zinc-ribbon domain-containing protein [Planctomycetaceae bacterium]|nr:zinc-ribbon domain-containing protein [Planctomycetaceae bacterium]